MSNFRPGDIVTVELTVSADDGGDQWLISDASGGKYPYMCGPRSLGSLIAAGKVTLVRRAEPDWKPGDIGQHIETGIKYVRCSAPRPWLQVTGDSNEVGRWQHSDYLAGKLVRCTVTPEVTSPDDHDAYHHSHLCQAAKRGHRWTHTADSERCDGWVKTCQNHREVTS